MKAVVVALVETHPDPKALAAKMERMTQLQLAKLETDRAHERKMIKGYQGARELLLREKETPRR